MNRFACLLLLWGAPAFAQPAVRPVPPPGIEIPAADRAGLQSGLDRLRAATAALHGNPLLPDVLIFQEAVRAALDFDGFYKADEVAKARALLRTGEERAAALAAGQAPWTSATGLVVRGYISKIDRSVQPYGLVVPPSYSPTATSTARLSPSRLFRHQLFNTLEWSIFKLNLFHVFLHTHIYIFTYLCNFDLTAVTVRNLLREYDWQPIAQ